MCASLLSDRLRAFLESVVRHFVSGKILKRIKCLRDVKKLNVPGTKETLGSAAPINHPKPPRKPTPDLGDKLRRLRKKVSLTVTEAAQRAQIFPGFLSAIERLNCLAATFCRYNLPIGSRVWRTELELYDLPCAIKPRDSATQPQEPGN
jgi:hypothetical protein